jgi:hypothetical protein
MSNITASDSVIKDYQGELNVWNTNNLGVTVHTPHSERVFRQRSLRGSLAGVS